MTIALCAITNSLNSLTALNPADPLATSGNANSEYLYNYLYSDIAY